MKDVTFSSDFLDNFIFKAKPEYAQVYIYAYARKMSGINVTSEDISKSLKIDLSTVKKAEEYWKGQGFDIFSQKHFPPSLDKSTYSADEISDFAKNDGELSVLYEEVSKIMDKPLSTNDIQTLFWIYNDLGFSALSIIMMTNYAKRENKCRMRFIEKTAQQWFESGIISFKDVEKHLAEIENKNNYEHKIKKIYGIYDRNFTSSEKEIIADWNEKLKPTKADLEKAYEICIEKTGKFSVRYINAVLVNWKKDKKPAKTRVPAPKSTGFNNFTDNRKVDYKKIEREALKRRILENRKDGEADE
ncbi:MAG: DnaD domain protein [Clostridia bacterium]|nr:DnaD domain protein [Clostridia bacterium]